MTLERKSDAQREIDTLRDECILFRRERDAALAEVERLRAELRFHGSASNALRALLLFHHPGPWTTDRAKDWDEVAPGRDCTSKTVCDLARKALGIPEEP